MPAMIDLLDFITDRGGNPEKIRESQRRRHAPVEIVDEIIEKFEDHKKTQYAATQIGSKINETQKAIGQKKKAKEAADDLLKQKEALQQEKLAQEKLAAEKLRALQITAKFVGNYVHDSVPISNDEVGCNRTSGGVELMCAGKQRSDQNMGTRGPSARKE